MSQDIVDKDKVIQVEQHSINEISKTVTETMNESSEKNPKEPEVFIKESVNNSMPSKDLHEMKDQEKEKIMLNHKVYMPNEILPKNYVNT